MTMKNRIKLSVNATGDISIAARPVFAGDEECLQSKFSWLLDQGGAHLLITPNVDQIIDLERSEASQAAFNAASLRILDGMPLIFLARFLGAKGPQRHTGADLLPTAVGWARDKSWKVAITGGSAKISQQAAARLRAQYAGASVISIDFPQISSIEDTSSLAVVKRLQEYEPDIVFLCLGSPKQESWFLHWKQSLPEGIYIGAGAAVDFAANSRSRAPKLVQRAGLEWLWRLLQEPRRLTHRYLIKGPLFLRFIFNSTFGRNK